jgi:hypothetical protein
MRSVQCSQTVLIASRPQHPKQRAAYLLEVIHDRHQRRSTIVTSQLPVSHWHEALGEQPSPTQCWTAWFTTPTAAALLGAFRMGKEDTARWTPVAGPKGARQAESPGMAPKSEQSDGCGSPMTARHGSQHLAVLTTATMTSPSSAAPIRVTSHRRSVHPAGSAAVRRSGSRYSGNARSIPDLRKRALNPGPGDLDLQLALGGLHPAPQVAAPQASVLWRPLAAGAARETVTCYRII